MLVSFEGIDGSGKSTQARRLAEALRGEGREVVLTREPGGSPGAEEIRALLVEGASSRWSPETEICLFTAARRDHWERTIAPALDRGAVVVTDRFVDSTRVYQGLRGADRRGANLRRIVDLLHDELIGREAERTLLIDMPAEASLARARARHIAEQRFEGLGLDFQIRARAAFLALAEATPRIAVVDGTGPEDAVAARVRAAIPC